MWLASGNKKRKLIEEQLASAAAAAIADDDPLTIPLALPKGMEESPVYSQQNHVYFNAEITKETVFQLNRELRYVENKQNIMAQLHGMSPSPIYLHITTDGGCIYSAFSAIDCIQSLSVPVYTVVDGFVASAGTLISVAGEKRYIRPNAYMLIHQLRSSFWGKMAEITEEVDNLKKIMAHIENHYTKYTTINKKNLEKILSKDVIWNSDECLQRGLVDDIITKL